MPRSNPIDVHVGLRIRQRRVLLGMNMWNLGVAVGLSFQMIQKYEAGFCCIPVSRLFELANALDVSPSFFFEGPRPRAMDDSLYTRETMDLVRAYTTISNSSVRHSIAGTIRAICSTSTIASPAFLNFTLADLSRPGPLGLSSGFPTAGRLGARLRPVFTYWRENSDFAVRRHRRLPAGFSQSEAIGDAYGHQKATQGRVPNVRSRHCSNVSRRGGGIGWTVP
jgi:transcriptional regulator with XRE-family HTH domain